MRARAELAEGDLARALGKETRARAAFAAAVESARACELVPVEEAARDRAAART
jgi:predicted negative regulator of RcsB-dependent stress response